MFRSTNWFGCDVSLAVGLFHPPGLNEVLPCGKTYTLMCFSHWEVKHWCRSASSVCCFTCVVKSRRCTLSVLDWSVSASKAMLIALQAYWLWPYFFSRHRDELLLLLYPNKSWKDLWEGNFFSSFWDSQISHFALSFDGWHRNIKGSVKLTFSFHLSPIFHIFRVSLSSSAVFSLVLLWWLEMVAVLALNLTFAENLEAKVGKHHVQVDCDLKP